jgi:glycosyltransferase involved in cell wall biosynthesis
VAEDRICIITHSGYPVEPRARRMAEALADHGYAVDVLCLQLPGQAAKEAVNGVHVCRLPESRHQGAGAIVYLREYVRFFCLAWQALSQLHRAHPYALVQVYNPPDPLVFCTLPLKLAGVPVVLDLRELMPELFMSRFQLTRGSSMVRLLTLFEHAACAYADAVIILHEPHRQIMLGRGVPAAKMTQVMNCPDERWFGGRLSPPNPGPRLDGEFIVMYHGAILERYGVDLLVQAVAQVRQEIPGIRLELYGTGDFLSRVETLVRELDLGEIVWFHGQRPLEEMASAIALADVGVVPMRQDIFTDCIMPTKLLEYVAVGIPAIAARTATTAAYFDDTTVQLFAPGDLGDLAHKLIAVYRDPATAAAQAERARSFMAKHNWQGEKERYLALIAGLVARTKRADDPPGAESCRFQSRGI